MKSSLPPSLLPAVVLMAGGFCAVAAPDERDHEFFRKKIQPIFTEHCYKCHSHGDKIKGGLVVDSLSGVLTGGDTGPAVVPGKPEESLLIKAVAYEDDDLQMPPKGKKLSEEQIALLTDWVKRGAPWPEEPGKKAARPKGRITDEDRQWWAFQPVARVQPPTVEDGGWSANEIDRFVFQKLQSNGLKPAPPAAPEQIVRRLYFDLIGLPPRSEEVSSFVLDHKNAPIPAAKRAVVEKLVDELLASPRYGEQWARHWLDLVRYAESDGYRIDDYRPHAWRYRDYVIRSLNADKPYDRFVQEQIAGDEIAPGDVEARIATGYLRHWIYEYNNRDVVLQWSNILNDITDTTADVFLGTGLQCARCHDHKFDPILQKDYFRFQAFFAPLLPRDDLKLATAEMEAEYREKLRSWEEKTAELRREIDALEAPHKEKAAADAIAKFPPETQALIRKPAAERTPYEEQLVQLALRQVYYEYDRLLNKMKGPDKDKLVGLYKQLSAFDNEKPEPPAPAFAATDVGTKAPPVFIPKKQQLGEIEPGVLTILDEKPLPVSLSLPNSTGRRAALAQWMTNPENPLTPRVIVNRIWQYHFGRGLAVNASDFGKLGEPPSHPELLDWLARRFISDGWSLKKLHRLIVLSATYQQSVASPLAEIARIKDPENRLLWRGGTRRLDAEQIRDAILAVTGELDLSAGGPSVDWAKPRRTIYTKVVRNTRDPLLDVFDVPERFASQAQRNVTTTPTQSLLMINSPWALGRARAFASRLKKEATSSDETSVIADAYRLAYGREPRPEEIASVQRFLESQGALAALPKAEAKVAPFAADKLPFRDGRAALLVPGSPQDRLIVPDSAYLPKQDFTVEAFIRLNSLYEGGEVRTIASHWDGKKGHPGWSLGITSKGSRYKPQTLVLQLSGDQPWSDKDPIEPVFSGLHIELGKPYFIAVAVDLEDATEKGITFYAKDLSNDDEPMQSVQMKHKVTSGIRPGNVPLTIGGRSPDEPRHVFDGIIDDVRLSNVPLPPDQLLINKEGVAEHTVGYWRFEQDTGHYKDSAQRAGDILAKAIEAPKADPKAAALADFCHVLLNSNEFLYVD
jgi:mono/diheme cytochrome c family protein